MDAKITKERLSRMLSYDWLKIVGIIVAAIVFWSLIFTMTSTRITPAQQFTVVNYFGNVSAGNTDFSKSVTGAFSENIFSHEVLETTQVDVPGSGDVGMTLLEARISTYEGDVIFVPDILDEGTEYQVNGEKYQETYLQRLVRTYGYKLMNLSLDESDGFFKKLEAYLAPYYGGDFKNGTLNKEVVKQDFLARVKKNKDKRYKKDAEIQAGIAGDVERIEKYRAALIEFYGYVDSGLVSMTKTTAVNLESGETLSEGVYSINLCPNKDTMGNLSKIAAYAKTVEGESGETQTILSAENMNVAIFDFPEVEKGFEYESLLYINYVIRLTLGMN